jgi:hypothetical protein
MDSEPHIGFMLHGFSRDEAELVNEFLTTLVGRKVIPISATGMEKLRVAEILNSASFSDFASSEPKILMFLGFGDDKIGAAMKHFPPDLGRPIFCSPTEQNLQWTFDYLVEHLMEERASLGH